MVQVQEAIARARVPETICDNPLAYNPQSNGGAERGVEEVKNQMRAIKISLVMRLQAPVEARRAIMEWMIPHSADFINRFC